MAPAEGAEDKTEPNFTAQALQSSDGSDGGASDDKEDEEETKFVEWDPSGRFGRVSEISAPPVFSFCTAVHAVAHDGCPGFPPRRSKSTSSTFGSERDETP
jgi:hypothetical protein